MKRPSIKECMLRTAEIFAERSVCSRLNVGCVITNKEMTNIEAIGYNGKEKGGSHEPDSDEPGKTGMIHAEENALIKADYKVKEKKLFVTHSPCLMCARKIINAEIAEVYFKHAYRDPSPIHLLEKKGVKCFQLDPDGSGKFYRQTPF